MCYPILFERSDFYLSQDMEFVMEDVKVHSLINLFLSFFFQPFSPSSSFPFSLNPPLMFLERPAVLASVLEAGGSSHLLYDSARGQHERRKRAIHP